MPPICILTHATSQKSLTWIGPRGFPECISTTLCETKTAFQHGPHALPITSQFLLEVPSHREVPVLFSSHHSYEVARTGVTSTLSVGPVAQRFHKRNQGERGRTERACPAPHNLPAAQARASPPADTCFIPSLWHDTARLPLSPGQHASHTATPETAIGI